MSNWRLNASNTGLPIEAYPLAASYIPLPGYFVLQTVDAVPQWLLFRQPPTGTSFPIHSYIIGAFPKTGSFPGTLPVDPDH